MPAIYDLIRAAQDDARLRQHAHAGRVRVPGALGPERRRARRSRSTTARSTSRQRRRVEAAMAEGRLRAVVCTSTLDLGIDWGDVDLVVNVGAPKGASPHHAAHRPRQPPPRRALEGLPRPGEPLRDPRMPRRARRRARGGAGHARRPHRRARRALPSTSSAWPAPSRSPSTTLYEEVRSAAPYAGTGAARTSRPSSISSRPAATRCAPTSASPRSCAARTGSGGCATAASRSNTGSTSAPSSRRR